MKRSSTKDLLRRVFVLFTKRGKKREHGKYPSKYRKKNIDKKYINAKIFYCQNIEWM
jgi:hypothetical protein